jgi:hypothetical protein
MSMFTLALSPRMVREFFPEENVFAPPSVIVTCNCFWFAKEELGDPISHLVC